MSVRMRRRGHHRCLLRRSRCSAVETAHCSDPDRHHHVGPPNRFVLVDRPLSSSFLPGVFPERAAAAVSGECFTFLTILITRSNQTDWERLKVEK